MAGTTEHYGLSLLGAEDEAGRGTLNGNFERADAALEALARAMEEGLAGKAEVVWGLYTGLGSEETVTVELGFRPRALIVSPHGSYSSGAISALYFYGVIGATLIVIFLLHLSLKRRERLRAEREADLSANSSAAQSISQSDASDDVVPEAPQNDKK